MTFRILTVQTDEILGDVVDIGGGLNVMFTKYTKLIDGKPQEFYSCTKLFGKGEVPTDIGSTVKIKVRLK